MTAAAAAQRRNASIRRLLIGAVALSALVLVGMIGITLAILSSYRATTRWVNHTYAVKETVSSTRMELSGRSRCGAPS